MATIRRIHYLGKEEGDRWAKAHYYYAYALDEIRPEHRGAVAMLDALDPIGTDTLAFVRIERLGDRAFGGANDSDGNVVYVYTLSDIT